MSNDNRTSLKADHRQHSDNHKTKSSSHSYIGFISVMTVLVMSLLVPSCQPTNAQTSIKVEVNNHA